MADEIVSEAKCPTCGLTSNQIPPIWRYIYKNGDLVCSHPFGVPAQNVPEWRLTDAAPPENRVLLSTGRMVEAQGGVIGLTSNGDIEIMAGYDGGLTIVDPARPITQFEEPTRDEYIELAKHMVERWKQCLQKLMAQQD